jgi:hypothetical protein
MAQQALPYGDGGDDDGDADDAFRRAASVQGLSGLELTQGLSALFEV